ncbi:hypothetical protein [Stackebrandtia nassauensis]|uniref:Uncharacterized protein n=1 Tax=Stackebrandtia nassauensis (strain DSM 44728 / CIP 108903 / NRRL B-16338 / NBRC 102104 / LLR-40K-21) TaxID=446470 RepID=D3QAX7_STANL|nr:hypothetical protein [Stackebrandtia nassauensis]ADD44773.1 hypothetical protein Snas_5138 [Stackebrandtia nassauensis DSM 44728]
MKVRKEFDEATAAHRAAAGHLERARALLPKHGKAPVTDRQRALVTRLAQAALAATPGWLGHRLTGAMPGVPLGEADAAQPLSVRVGECRLDDDHRFPAVVNLLGTGHLAVDADATDPRAMSLLRSVPLRLLAARPSETLNVSFVDCCLDGEVFAPFGPLVEAGLAPEVATGEIGLAGVLDTAEAHLDHARRRGGAAADLPERLVVIAGLPPEPGAVTARLANLIASGPEARLHLVLADARVRPNRSGTRTTHVSLSGDRATVAGIPLPVRVDAEPEPELITELCGRLAANRQWVIEDDLT